MNTKLNSLFRFSIKYGLLLAAIPTIYNIVLVILGLHLDYNHYGDGLGESYSKARSYLLPVLLFIAIYIYRKGTIGALSLKRIVKLGLWIFLTASILIISYNLVFRFIIEPDWATKFYEINREEIYTILVEGHQETGREYTQADMDTHVSRNGNLWNMLFANLVLNFVFTLFFSLVFGFFLRKK
ncbi:DUF4199 domain-containing protein [Aquimarina litoralis]|uniref:DUF4199 domain-containing protein n=1 Tax=Aquimarina litoralis TaxID=584605 RepID=UPI001C587FBE|nr:DUF4199 domain-containing protein [Aquimarina litoralis]MBW1295400.1 DUF4199 family protein [Aquimarina litoralis]